jgi:predicted nucleic acid-binding Zn ribbon protein
MIYGWKCDCCGTAIEVERKMCDSAIPPDEPCPCGAGTYIRTFTPTPHVGPTFKGKWSSHNIGGLD